MAAPMDPSPKSSADSEPEPTNVVEALDTQKHPPPETAEFAWTRQKVILSFWAIVLLLGLPIWWKTTAIYRANLPLQEMIDWADGKVCRPVFPLRIAVKAPSLSYQETQNLLKTTQHALDDLNEFSAHHLRLIQADLPPRGNSSQAVTAPITEAEERVYSEHDDDVALLIRLRPGFASNTNEAYLQPYSQTLDIYYMLNQIPSSSSSSSPLATFIANELQKVFAEEQASLAHLLSSVPSQAPAHKNLSPEISDTLAKRTTRSFRYAPTYHLTFSLFTPEAAPSAWEIESALDEYLAPLLASLSSISNFTVDMQVQLYSKFSPSIAEPKWDEIQKAWTLRHEDLSGFINAAEWPLSPSIGEGPTVNFVLYVPSAQQSPLVIETIGGNSWLVPQWGGVHILNPAVNTSTTASSKLLTKDAMQPAMMTFSTQLLSLLGLPETPRSLPLRISTLTRVRVASLIFSASSTLGALARLTQTLPSIAIPDTVAFSVSQTITHLHRACGNLRAGTFANALKSARVAEAEAEKAFFERSMVGQVYFPDEHKVAVYLPLLGPIAVPLVMAGIKELRGLKARRSGAA